AECANIQCSDGSRAMADVAHDASGPASPKSGDVAPQQASRPDSLDKGKLRVFIFISYSRDDLKFADQLDAALSDVCGFECVIDRHGISGGEDWKRRLVLVLLVVLIVGVSRRRRVAHDGDEAPVDKPSGSVLEDIRGHVASCLGVATFADGLWDR